MLLVVIVGAEFFYEALWPYRGHFLFQGVLFRALVYVYQNLSVILLTVAHREIRQLVLVLQLDLQ